MKRNTRERILEVIAVWNAGNKNYNGGLTQFIADNVDITLTDVKTFLVKYEARKAAETVNVKLFSSEAIEDPHSQLYGKYGHVIRPLIGTEGSAFYNANFLKNACRALDFLSQCAKETEDNRNTFVNNEIQSLIADFNMHGRIDVTYSHESFQKVYMAITKHFVIDAVRIFDTNVKIYIKGIKKV